MILPLIKFPDEKLKTISMSVTRVTKELQALGQDLIDTLEHHTGLGLAAIQIGDPVRVIALKLGTETKNPKVMLMYNPIIVSKSKLRRPSKEGCLSFDYECIVKRHTEVSIKYRDNNNKMQFIQLKGLDAIIAQHEIEHLNGITFNEIQDKVVVVRQNE